MFTLFRREQKGVDVPASRFNSIERKMKRAMIIEYNLHMGGVDKMDQSRSYYGVVRSSKKYWKHILFNIFNIAIINIFILFKQNNPRNDGFPS